VPRPRMPVKLSESVHRQLSSYALAASATGVSVLALIPPAEAKIVYTPAHRRIGPSGHFALDLNHDGIPDFSLSASLSTHSRYGRRDVLSVTPLRLNGVLGYNGLAAALGPGVLVGPKRFFQYLSLLMARATQICTQTVDCNTLTIGNWANVTGRYLGLMFLIQGKAHYGWARLNVTVDGSGIRTLLRGYTYETVANKAIRTGKTKGAHVITLEPASLGHLARGASAIGTWRGTN